MTFREWTGLCLLVLALALIPVAWAFSRVLWLVSFVLIVVGSWLFYTRRIHRRERRLEKEVAGQHTEVGHPNDIHNYTGWQHGGRSTTMDSRPEAVELDDADA